MLFVIPVPTFFTCMTVPGRTAPVVSVTPPETEAVPWAFAKSTFAFIHTSSAPMAHIRSKIFRIVEFPFVVADYLSGSVNNKAIEAQLDPASEAHWFEP